MPHFLTLADSSAKSAVNKSGGSDGQGELLKALAASEMGRSELYLHKTTWHRKMDHMHLTRYTGTDFCQWTGRCADGFHRPIGRIMQIVEAK